MKVGEVKEIAKQWISEHATKIPGFAGAFYAGSTASLPDEEDFGSLSDVDVNIVIDGDKYENARRAKFLHKGIVIDVSYGLLHQCRTPEQLLANGSLAYHFRVPNIIFDPSGHLKTLQQAVARDFARRQWVEERCRWELRNALRWAEGCLSVESEDDYMLERSLKLVLSIIFGVSVPALADLRAPTFRKSLIRYREVLAKYGKSSEYEDTLAVLGCAELCKPDVEALLEGATTAFNRAVQVIKTPFLGDFNICEAARTTSIESSQKLISSGDHREAVFSIMAAFSGSVLAIQNDAPDDEKLPFLLSYQKAMDALDLGTEKHFLHRVDQWKDKLNEIRDIADEILDMNPEIQD